MLAPPTPSQETERLAELYERHILDTPREPVFDQLAGLAAYICGTPYAAITFIDANRQWIKASHGFDLTETPRDQSVCAHAILEHRFVEIPDLQQDPRFVDNPTLGTMRFYGGSQLTTPHGNNLGMLCVMDEHPRHLSSEQCEAMQQLARVLSALLQGRKAQTWLAWFGALINGMGDEIYVIDADSLHFIHANACAVKSLGRPLSELRRRTVRQVTSSPQPVEDALRALREGAGEVSQEIDRPGGDGAAMTLEVRWRMVHTPERNVIVVTARNISERKAVERMKDELVSLISHELRTPLTSLRGAVKLLEAGAGGSLPEKAQGLASIAAQGSDRLLAILNDLLDLDRIASSSMNFQLAAVDAAEALSQVARAFEGLAMSQHVQLRVHAPAGLMLMADPQRLQQVLGNLVSNAIKFAPDGSAVELEAHAEPGPASGVRLGVTDHGPGLPESFRPLVFQRFAQADQRTNRAQGGSGLGLSIVKAMVEQMNGSVGFESEPGRTLFHIRLPGAAA